MIKALGHRLSLLERQLADRGKCMAVCTCRVTTSFHDPDCLDAILKAIPPVQSMALESSAFFSGHLAGFYLRTATMIFVPVLRIHGERFYSKQINSRRTLGRNGVLRKNRGIIM